MTRNAREIRKVGLKMGHLDTTHVILDNIRHLLLSSSSTGQFQMPPKDADIRRHLFANGLLSCESAQSDEIFNAMASYLKSLGIIPNISYNGRVVQCLNVYTSRLRHPSSRRQS